MNLTQFQQSELKRLIENSFPTRLEGAELVYSKVIILETALELFLSAIEKAFALGKEEKGNKILEKVNKLKGKYWGNRMYGEIQREKCDIYDEAIDNVINLLKNK